MTTNGTQANGPPGLPANRPAMPDKRALQRQRQLRFEIDVGRCGVPESAYKTVKAFRHELYRQIEERGDSVTRSMARRIFVACLALRESLRASVRMREGEGKLKAESEMAYSDRATRNAQTWLRIVESLGLDGARTLDWSAALSSAPDSSSAGPGGAREEGESRPL